MDFETLITNAVGPQGQATQISLFDLVISLTVALIVCLGAAFIYRKTHRGMTYERTFLVTLVLLGPIVGLIILLIGSNLALSLGMVGALSIIRFRTVIKDSRDMIYLFWAIAAGLGAGTYNWNVIFVASIILGVAVWILHYLQFGKTQHQECIFVLNGTGHAPEDTLQKILSSHSIKSTIRSIQEREDGWEMVFEVRFPPKDAANLTNFLQEARSITGVENASLLAPHLSLPI